MTNPLFERLNGPTPTPPSTTTTPVDSTNPLFKKLNATPSNIPFTPFSSPTSNTRSPEEIEEEQRKKRRNVLGDKPTEWGVWGVGSPAYALVDMLYGAGQDVKQVFTGEGGGIGNAVGSVAGTVGQLLNPLNLVENVKGLVTGLAGQAVNIGELVLEALPGIDRLSPEEQNKKIQIGAVDVAAFYLGAKAVQATGKATKAAQTIGRIDDLALAEKVFDALPAAGRVSALRAGVGETGVIRNALKVGRNASVAAAAPGLFYGDSPEERVSNAINFGVVAGMFGMATGASRAVKSGRALAGWQNFKETVVQSRAQKIAAGIPEEFEHNIKDFDSMISAIAEHRSPEAAREFLRKVIRTNTPENEIGLFTDLPLTDKAVSKQGPRILDAEGKSVKGADRGWEILTYKHPVTNKQVALVAPEGQVLPLTKSEIGQFKATGFYEGMQAEFSGQKVRVVGIKGTKATINVGGKTSEVKIADLKHSTSIGVERIVDLPQPEIYKFGSPEWMQKFGADPATFNPSHYWAPLDLHEWKVGNDVISVSSQVKGRTLYIDLIELNGEGLDPKNAGAVGHKVIRDIHRWYSDALNIKRFKGERATGSRRKSLSDAFDSDNFDGYDEDVPSNIVIIPAKKASKPFGIVKELDDLDFHHSEAIDVIQLQDEIVKYKEAQVSNISARAANAGYSIEYKNGKLLLQDLGDTSLDPVEFAHPREIAEYIDTLNANPKGELLGINPSTRVQLANQSASVSPTTNVEMKLSRANLSWLSKKGIEFTQLMQALQVQFPDIPLLEQTFKLENASRRLVARLKPFQEQLDTIFKNFERARKNSKVLNNELAADYLDALSFDEAVGKNPLTRLFRGRDVNDIEIQHHKELLALALKGIDENLVDPSDINAAGLENLNAATVAIKRILETSSKRGFDTPERIHAAINALEDLTPAQKDVANFILAKKEGFQGNLGIYSIYAPVELTRLKLSESLSKADFIKKFNLSPDDVKALNELRTWFDNTGTEFGIGENQKLNHYFPRVFTDVEGYVGRLPESLKRLYEDPFFDHALHRVGVGVEYNKSITYVTTNYIHNAARKEILLPALKQFENTVMKDLKGPGMAVANEHGKSFYHGEELVNIMNTHLRELQGFASPEENLAELIKVQTAQKLKIKPAEYKSFVDRIVGMLSFSTMGGNFLLGLRDATSMVQAIVFKFGTKGLKEIIALDNAYASKLARKTATELLKAEGKTPNTLSRWLYKDLDDAASNSITNKVSEGLASTQRNVGEAAFKMTMQAQVYDKFHRMVYNWSMDKYTRAINEFGKHKNFEQFAKAIELDAHNAGVRLEFKKIFDRGEFHKGGEFLAWSKAHEALSVYGQANHPIGWASAHGRLLGQYGKWPLWALRQMADNMTGPGSGKRIARWATASAAIYGLGAGSGINFDTWVYNPMNMVFKGGPVVDFSVDALNALTSNDPMQKEQAQREMFGPILNMMEGDGKALDWKSPFIPIPYSIWNLLEGSGVIEPGKTNGIVMDKNPELALAKMLGFSIAPSGNLFWPGNPASELVRKNTAQKIFDKVIP